jgi:hypothetical protein
MVAPGEAAMSMTDTSITATRALYIKLGEGGRWAQLAFESGTLRFGFPDIPHEQARAAAAGNDFLSVKDFYKGKGVAPGTATRYANEVRNFYTAGADVLWITFANGRMWWCFANTEVVPTTALDPDEAGSRYRRSIGGWKDKDLAEQTLWTNSLRGSLTTTAGFRGTICRVREFDYLLRRLNGQETLATKAAREARLTLIKTLTPLIRGLYWKDFELLVELVMTQGGWRRVSETGGTQKTIDLELELPLTGERALVQVKSKLDQTNAETVAAELTEAAGDARAFLVYHTASGQLHVEQENVTLIGPEMLSEHVVDVGLTNWVMTKVG